MRKPRTLNEATVHLLGTDHNVARRAAYAFPKWGIEALDRLSELISSNNPHDSRAAAMALELWEDESHTSALLEQALTSSDKDTFAIAAHALMSAKRQTIPLLLPLANSEDSFRRSTLARLMRDGIDQNMSLEQILEVVEPLASDQSPTVRQAALNTLRLFADWRDWPLLPDHSYRLCVWADHHLFYLCDAVEWTSVFAKWDTDLYSKKVSPISNTCIYISTDAYDTIPFAITIEETTPSDDDARWDCIVQCAIDIPSGRLAYYELFTENPVEICSVPPGQYGLRAYIGNRSKAENNWAEDEFYLFVLWPITERLDWQILRNVVAR